jgi:hypothetical protein
MHRYGRDSDRQCQTGMLHVRILNLKENTQKLIAAVSFHIHM